MAVMRLIEVRVLGSKYGVKRAWEGGEGGTE